jgi:hypothetical protein
MTYFIGSAGNVRLRRNAAISVASEVRSSDINTTLNRVGFDNALDNLLTGDRLQIWTDDPRGLVFFPTTSWVDGEGVTQAVFSQYVNVNAAGGVRFFDTFQAAVNNVRSEEIPVQTFAGDPLRVYYTVSDVTANLLGDVTGYSFNTDREAIDTTTLSDKYKQMYSAGIISGSGSIDCIFNYETSGVKETPLLALQLINRVDIGSECDMLLAITDNDNDPQHPDIYYEFTAVITRSGLQVSAGELITCTIDFLTTGEVKLLVGRPSGYILKEDDFRIKLNQSLDFLLTEVTD